MAAERNRERRRRNGTASRCADGAIRADRTGNSGSVPDSDPGSSSDSDRSPDSFTEPRSRRRVLGAVAGVGAGGLVGSLVRRSPAGDRANDVGDDHGHDHDAEGDRSSGRGMAVGIHAGSDVGAIGRTDRIESWAGSRFDVQNVFVPFDNGRYELDELFDRVLPGIWGAGRTPMLSFEPYLSSGPTPEDVLRRITAGEYDAFLDEWAGWMAETLERGTWQADAGRTWGRMSRPAAYVRFAHEANGNWYPWAPAGGDGTPGEYVEAWRYVRSRVNGALTDRSGLGGSEAGGDGSELAWVWAVNGIDVGPYMMEELYPGDAFVDWAGVDTYNWGDSEPWSRWRSPDELFDEPIERVRRIVGGDTPIGITEFASSSRAGTGYDVERKAAWIRDAFDTLDRAAVDMAVWFNRDRKTDWAVFDGARGTDRIERAERRYQVYPAYREAVTGQVR